jgi:hypothetical protein
MIPKLLVAAWNTGRVAKAYDRFPPLPDVRGGDRPNVRYRPTSDIDQA